MFLNFNILVLFATDMVRIELKNGSPMGWSEAAWLESTMDQISQVPSKRVPVDIGTGFYADTY